MAISSTFSSNLPRHFRIVTSFSILKNWIDVLTHDISTEVLIIETLGLVPLQSDPHVYQPTPKDARNLTNADLIVTLGLSFECWMDRLINASETKATIIKVAKNVKARVGRSPDPHVWHDVQKARQMVQNLSNVLVKLLPEAAEIIKKNALNYDERLIALDKTIKEQISKLPMNRRKIITTHDAFHYYGEAYGLVFCAPVGLSTEVEADAKNVASLIQQIKAEHITAIFFENLANRTVVRQIAEETGLSMNENNVLYADSLSDQKGQAPNYIKMIQHNTTLIIKALAQ